MVSFAVHPAGKPDIPAGIGQAERAASVGPVGMHGRFGAPLEGSRRAVEAGAKGTEAAGLSSTGPPTGAPGRVRGRRLREWPGNRPILWLFQSLGGAPAFSPGRIRV
ncbi:hypothetical protein FRZ61_30610 [Hypericibacter adhaerens]|uniref:Uncharacterized protein n=1 Tax=Hypericibacter adhaerens TaxID=2602016 RepID=A0A5J6N7N4_9PROT|nr:hypothetical protein FRZ61_30610 [Hypericibacter adhaerens]